MASGEGDDITSYAIDCNRKRFVSSPDSLTDNSSPQLARTTMFICGILRHSVVVRNRLHHEDEELHFCAFFLDFRAPLLYPAAMSDLNGSADIPLQRTPLSELNARAGRLQDLM